ncbi:hypothetical protein ACVNP0_11150 [Staphylococcus aureus]
MSGKVLNGCHLGGGLHHAQPGRASGFCIYNDIAITAQYLAKEYNQRVLIIDTDAHHGDGTRWTSMPITMLLLILSMKTRESFFPGSGHYTERGEDIGYGHTVNVPLEPYTEDASFLECFKLTVEPVVKSFKI